MAFVLVSTWSHIHFRICDPDRSQPSAIRIICHFLRNFAEVLWCSCPRQARRAGTLSRLLHRLRPAPADCRPNDAISNEIPCLPGPLGFATGLARSWFGCPNVAIRLDGITQVYAALRMEFMPESGRVGMFQPFMRVKFVKFLISYTIPPPAVRRSSSRLLDPNSGTSGGQQISDDVLGYREAKVVPAPALAQWPGLTNPIVTPIRSSPLFFFFQRSRGGSQRR